MAGCVDEALHCLAITCRRWARLSHLEKDGQLAGSRRPRAMTGHDANDYEEAISHEWFGLEAFQVAEVQSQLKPRPASWRRALALTSTISA